MGLPEIKILFQKLAVSAIARSQRGIVAMILKDDTDITFATKTYKSVEEIEATDYTAGNLDSIKLAFMGTPTKVIVVRLATTETDYNDALTILKNVKFDYLTIPGILTAECADVATWIKTQRVAGKVFKAVLPKHVADHEGIINFATDNLVVGAKTYATNQFTARIAGILAGLSLKVSSTYFYLPEVESFDESEDPDTDIGAGKLILIMDGGKAKIARGANSLVTTSADKTEDWKKIKLVEAMDLIQWDIRTTFNDNYIGKYPNTYDYQLLFFTAVNAYLKGLAAESVLDPNATNAIGVDVPAQRLAWESIGVDTSEMTDQQIKLKSFQSKVIVGGTVKLVDAIEDLKMTITLQ